MLLYNLIIRACFPLFTLPIKLLLFTLFLLTSFFLSCCKKKKSFPLRIFSVNVFNFLRIWSRLLKKSLMRNFIFWCSIRFFCNCISNISVFHIVSLPGFYIPMMATNGIGNFWIFVKLLVLLVVAKQFPLILQRNLASLVFFPMMSMCCLLC